VNQAAHEQVQTEKYGRKADDQEDGPSVSGRFAHDHLIELTGVGQPGNPGWAFMLDGVHIRAALEHGSVHGKLLRLKWAMKKWMMKMWAMARMASIRCIQKATFRPHPGM
jgi:hypothetical protein